MKHIFIAMSIASFCASSYASAPAQDVPRPVYNQKCFVNYSLSGYHEITQIACRNVKATCETLTKENRDSQDKLLALFQICLKGPSGNMQCATPQKQIPCARAIELLEQAQASCKD